MKKLIPIVVTFLCSLQANAQRGVYDGMPGDSTTFTFSTNDSLIHRQGYIDTTNAGIWRVGTTSKPFFSIAPTSGYAIMTDTSKQYDTSINNSFKVVLKAYNFNSILSFRHKYQTRAGMDGGIVEYSIDTGKTWNNVLGSCNIDSGGLWQGILTSNFYKKTDTLKTGEPAFSGTSNGWQYSRVQLFITLPIKTTGSNNCVSIAEIQFRFRFYSDNQPDTLDGWMIDDVKIEHDSYGGSVENTAAALLVSIYPNPASETLHIDMPEQYFNQVKIINPIGQTVFSIPLNNINNSISISHLPTGVYHLQLYSDYGIKTLLINKE